jgi:CRP-like cAMP-binding protein
MNSLLTRPQTLQRQDFSGIRELASSRAAIVYPSRTTIPLRSNELVIVQQGIVQLTTLHLSGDERLVGFAGPSMPLGLPLTALEAYQATALTKVEALRINIAEAQASPTIVSGLLQQVIGRLRQAEAWLALASINPLSERLRQLLALVAHEIGQPAPDGMRIPVRLTHQQLASAIGASRVSTTRMVNQLREEGWLAIDARRHYVVTAVAEGLLQAQPA